MPQVRSVTHVSGLDNAMGAVAEPGEPGALGIGSLEAAVGAADASPSIGPPLLGWDLPPKSDS